MVLLQPALVQLALQSTPPDWLVPASPMPSQPEITSPAPPPTIMVSGDFSIRDIHLVVPVDAESTENIDIRIQRVKIVKRGVGNSPVKRLSPVKKHGAMGAAAEGLNASVLLATLNAVEQNLFSPQVDGGSAGAAADEFQIGMVGLRLGCVDEDGMSHPLLR